MFKHYPQSLLAPASVALVGASERPGSLDSIVFRNLAGNILGANREMLDLAQHLGFTQQSRDGDDVARVSRL